MNAVSLESLERFCGSREDRDIPTAALLFAYAFFQCSTKYTHGKYTTKTILYPNIRLSNNEAQRKFLCGILCRIRQVNVSIWHLPRNECLLLDKNIQTFTLDLIFLYAYSDFEQNLMQKCQIIMK